DPLPQPLLFTREHEPVSGAGTREREQVLAGRDHDSRGIDELRPTMLLAARLVGETAERLDEPVRAGLLDDPHASRALLGRQGGGAGRQARERTLPVCPARTRLEPGVAWLQL